MKRSEYVALIIFLFVCLLLPVGWAIAIDWIQSTERVVGEGSAQYQDVVNRPAKQIWSLYTSEHNIDGSHKPEIFPTPLPTPTPITPTLIEEFALVGNGVLLANSGIYNSSTSIFNTPIYTMIGTVKADRLNTAESLYRRWQALNGTNYDTLVFNFHKSSDNRLAYSVYDAEGVTRTYYSQHEVFSAATQTRQIEVGITVDLNTPQIAFLYDGYMEPFQNTSSLYKTDLAGDSKSLGQGFMGSVYNWSVSEGQRYAPGYHTPPVEGISQCVRCLLYYDFDEGSGTILHDRIGNMDLIITQGNAIWQAVGSDY